MVMGRKRELTPGKSPAHFFGAELRRAREAAGMTMAEFCVKVPCAESTMSRIEGGFLSPDKRLAQVADETFPQYDGWFTRFYLESRDWVQAYPPSFRQFVEDEREATALYYVEHTLVPGMLQTEDYARVMLSSFPGATPERVAERVKARLERQALLTRDKPPMAWFLIDESAIRRCVGSPDLMRAQVARVAEMAHLSHICVQVLTVTAHVGVQGALHLAETDGVLQSANVEDIADGRMIDDSRTLAALAMRFRHLQTLALNAADSLAFTERLVDEWDKS
jgi:transcriptional regulator with XRE-family HTH domain